MNSGFDGRVYLYEYEWLTYQRRMPVRYIRKPHEGVCSICGQGPEVGNPLEHSHKIPFRVGIMQLALTPDFLDAKHNIVSAHKRGCNRAAEMDLSTCLAYLESSGFGQPPPFITSTCERKTAP